MDYRVTILKNGLRVVTISRPTRMTSAARVYVRAGSRYDGQSRGSAHLVEHMLFAGTTSRSSRQIYGDVESLGGTIQGSTAKEYSTFSTVVMDKFLESGLDVLADIMINPVFDPVRFLKEKLVILEEIRQAQDTQSVLWDKFYETLWVRNPVRWPTTGDPRSLGDLKYEEVVDFYRERYVARNMVVSICGDMGHDRAVEHVEREFGRLQSGAESRPLSAVEPTQLRQASHMVKDIHQTHLIMGVLATDMKDEDRYAVKLIDRILGSGGSSRLSQRLREDEKCAYTVFTVAPMYEDTGCLAVCASCNPESVPTVESMILEEWRRLCRDPVSDVELAAAKGVYEGTLVKECETNLYVAGVLGIEALLHKIEPFDESIEKVNAVAEQDIVQAAIRYLDAGEYAIVTAGRIWQE